MRKLLLFTIGVFLSFNISAQQNVAWETVWSGYDETYRGIDHISVLNKPNYYVAWTVAYDTSGNEEEISAIGITHDGGHTWTTYDPVELEGAYDLGISMVYPTTPTTAYLVAFKRGGSMGNGGVWKTQDSGETWQRVNSDDMYSDIYSFPNVVYFFDEDNGIVQGDPVNGEFEIYYTNDAGETWTAIDGDKIDDAIPGEAGYVRGYAAVGDTVWFTTSEGRIYRSTDKGQTWTAFDTPLSDFGGDNDSGRLAFATETDGWILRNNGELYKTTDGGETWTQMSPTGLYELPVDLAYIPGTNPYTLVIAGAKDKDDFGTQISYDGGETWTKITKYKLSIHDNYDDLPNFGLQDGDGNPVNNFLHVSLAFRDIDFGLSGGRFSVKEGENALAYGIFIFHQDYTNAITSNTIEELLVYPNPANNVVNVMAKNNIKNIAIFDITGKEVISKNKLNLNKASFDISNLEKGIYLMKIVDNTNAQETLKLVVK